MLAFDNRGGFICFILGVSILTTVSEREMNAYIDPYLGAFVYLMSWQIMLCVLAMLPMDADMTSEMGDVMVGIVLLIVNIAMFAVVFYDTRGDVMRNRIEMASQQRARLVRHATRRINALPFLRTSLRRFSNQDDRRDPDAMCADDGIDLEDTRNSSFATSNPLQNDPPSSQGSGGEPELGDVEMELTSETGTTKLDSPASKRMSFIGIPNLKICSDNGPSATVAALESVNGLVINKLTTNMKWVVRTIRISEDHQTLFMYVMLSVLFWSYNYFSGVLLVYFNCLPFFFAAHLRRLMAPRRRSRWLALKKSM